MKQKCSQCQGKGRVDETHNETRRCPTCEGAGEVDRVESGLASNADNHIIELLEVRLQDSKEKTGTPFCPTKDTEYFKQTVYMRALSLMKELL